MKFQRQWFWMKIVPLILTSIIPVVSISSCKQQKNKSISDSTSTVQKFSLEDVGFTDHHIQATRSSDAKEKVREHVKKLTNHKNEFLNGHGYELVELTDYQLVDFEQLNWTQLVDLSESSTQVLTITVKAKEESNHLNFSEINFKVTNHQDLSQYYDLSTISLEPISLSSKKTAFLKTSITNKITKQLKKKFEKRLPQLQKIIKNTNWTIANFVFDQLIQRLISGYHTGISFDVLVQPVKNDTLLINSVHVTITNVKPKIVYISELPTNYTIKEYAQAITVSREAIAQMDNSQLIEEINKVIKNLEDLNQDSESKIDNSLLKMNGFKFRLENGTLEKSDFENAYLCFSKTISSYFFPSRDSIIAWAQVKKQAEPALKETMYTLATQSLFIVSFAMKSQFCVQELFILCNEYYVKNSKNTDILKWPSTAKRIIGNTAIALTIWRVHCDFWEIFSLTQTHQTSPSLPNMNDFQPDMDNFNGIFKNDHDSRPQVIVNFSNNKTYLISNIDFNTMKQPYRSLSFGIFFTVKSAPDITLKK